MAFLTCPFCKRTMSYDATDMLAFCTWDGFKMNMRSYRGYFPGRHEDYIEESWKFLIEFQKTDPLLVMSPAPLWSKSFLLKDCYFIGCRNISENVTCIDMANVNVQNMVVNNYLIAGNRVLADEIVPIFYGSLQEGSEDNPLVRTSVPSPEHFLWTKCIMENSVHNMNNTVAARAFNAYFQSSLEGIADILFGIFGDKQQNSLTAEQALYAHIFIEPHYNIQWGKKAEGLLASCENFLLACCKDLENVEHKKFENVGPINEDDQRYKEMLSEFLLSMPSIAVNNIDSDTPSYFDILNHEWQFDYTSGHRELGDFEEHYRGLRNTYSMFYALYNKYGFQNKDFGVDSKLRAIEFMSGKSYSGHLNPDDVVLDFWRKVTPYVVEVSGRRA